MSFPESAATKKGSPRQGSKIHGKVHKDYSTCRDALRRRRGSLNRGHLAAQGTWQVLSNCTSEPDILRSFRRVVLMTSW